MVTEVRLSTSVVAQWPPTDTNTSKGAVATSTTDTDKSKGAAATAANACPSDMSSMLAQRLSSNELARMGRRRSLTT